MPYKDPERQRARDVARYAAQKADPLLLAKERERKRLVAQRKREKDIEHVRRLRRESMRRCPEKRREWEASRRAKKLQQFIEAVDPSVVYQMHGGRCGICGEFIEGEFHVDHVIPLSKRGMHGYVNVQPAHPVCNLRKGARV